VSILATYSLETRKFVDCSVYNSVTVMYRITSVYTARMSGVFMISLGTIWIRTRLMPRWVVFLTYALALGLLLTISSSLRATLIFPAWVCMVSIYILVANLRDASQEAPIKKPAT
jgi:hypothetical protein